MCAALLCEISDYRRIAALDTYEARDIDNRKYDNMSMEARLAAEGEIEAREKDRKGRRGRTPMAFRDDEGKYGVITSVTGISISDFA